MSLGLIASVFVFIYQISSLELHISVQLALFCRFLGSRVEIGNLLYYYGFIPCNGIDIFFPYVCIFSDKTVKTDHNGILSGGR